MLRRFLHLSVSPYSRQSLHLRLWVLFAIVLVAGCLFSDWQYRLQVARNRAYNLEISRLQDCEFELLAPICHRREAIHRFSERVERLGFKLRSPLLRQVLQILAQDLRDGTGRLDMLQVQTLLNGGRPFDLVKRRVSDLGGGYWPMAGANRNPDIRTVRWDDPKGRIRGELVFCNSFFAGYRLAWPSLRSPETLLDSDWLNFVHGWVVAAGPWVWGLAIVIAACFARHRLLAIECSVMWLIVHAVIQMPALSSHPQWDQLIERPFWPWVLTMLSWSLAMFAWAWFRQDARHRLLCSVCDYNLAGNRSGTCPECGTPVPAETLQRLRRGSMAGSSPVGPNPLSCPQQPVESLGITASIGHRPVTG